MSYKHIAVCDLCKREIDEMQERYIDIKNSDFKYDFEILEKKEHICETCRDKISDYIESLCL